MTDKQTPEQRLDSHNEVLELHSAAIGELCDEVERLGAALLTVARVVNEHTAIFHKIAELGGVPPAPNLTLVTDDPPPTDTAS